MFKFSFPKKAIVTFIIGASCLSASFVAGVFAADVDPKELLMEERSRLNIEMMQNSKRWTELSAAVVEQDQYCTIAKGMHDEMNALSQANEKKRQRAEEIGATLSGF